MKLDDWIRIFIIVIVEEWMMTSEEEMLLFENIMKEKKMNIPEIKFCKYCGASVSQEMDVCSKCGHKIEWRRVPIDSIIEKKDEVVTVKNKAKAIASSFSKSKDSQKPNSVKRKKIEIKNNISDDSTFYIVDLMKRIIMTRNIPICLYMALNLVFVCGVTGIILSDYFDLVESISFGLILYVTSIVITLSPVGEWILRFQIGCKKIKNPADLMCIEPIYREVYSRAKMLSPNLTEDIEFFIIEDYGSYAFATGRKTICVSRGFLNATGDDIKGVFGHEFGHLVNKDTDFILNILVR